MKFSADEGKRTLVKTMKRRLLVLTISSANHALYSLISETCRLQFPARLLLGKLRLPILGASPIIDIRALDLIDSTKNYQRLT